MDTVIFKMSSLDGHAYTGISTLFQDSTKKLIKILITQWLFIQLWHTTQEWTSASDIYGTYNASFNKTIHNKL